MKEMQKYPAEDMHLQINRSLQIIVKSGKKGSYFELTAIGCIEYFQDKK